MLRRTIEALSTNVQGRVTLRQCQAGNLTQEVSHMSIRAHLAELEKRHRALEEELTEALAHPSTDDLQIAALKRRKLLVKDEIARLRLETSVGLH